jgi:hypothetical protein
MLSRQIFVQAAAAAVICAASAIAQASPANEPTHGKMDMASWHQERCSDRYARHVGQIAYLEAKLSLTQTQRPLFANWKDSVLASAKSQESSCLAMHPDFAHPPSILDREARLHDMLQQRLSEMDAQRPAMTALYQSLTANQKQVFDGIGHGRAGMRSGPGSEGQGGWHHRGADRDQG